MKKLLLFVVAALFMGAACAYAQTGAAGDVELRLLERIFTGNIGLVIGLGVMILGLFTLVQGNAGGGIFLAVLGVLITLLPGVYNGVRNVVCPVAQALGGYCGEK